MKNLLALFSLMCVLGSFHTVFAQETSNMSDEIPSDYLERNPIYDYSGTLNNVDSIPDFSMKENKIKITGTVFQSDGITPAKDVIVFIYQPDENGDYEMKKENDKRYVYHRAWVKTDADGQYTFYTFIPGNFWRNKEIKHIHPVVKAPGMPEQEMVAFLFDNDPFLSKSCRKRLAKRGIDNILTVEEKDNMFVAKKDIVLEENTIAFK